MNNAYIIANPTRCRQPLNIIRQINGVLHRSMFPQAFFLPPPCAWGGGVRLRRPTLAPSESGHYNYYYSQCLICQAWKSLRVAVHYTIIARDLDASASTLRRPSPQSVSTILSPPRRSRPQKAHTYIHLALQSPSRAGLESSTIYEARV